MAIEIFYLTSQIHRWINVRVADHLAAQAAKLSRRGQMTTPAISFDSSFAEARGAGFAAGAEERYPAGQMGTPVRESQMVNA